MIKKNILYEFISFGMILFVLYVLIRQIILANNQNIILCLMTMLLLLLPKIIEKKLLFRIPKCLIVLIYFFIISTLILGEIYNLYNVLSFYDIISHLFGGFLLAIISFSLIKMFNIINNKLILLFIVCFSMTVGVFWEFFEFTMDNLFDKDMQKSVVLNNYKDIKKIDHTILYNKNDDILLITNGYLDTGLIDTMEDLVFDLIGIFIFLLLYLKDKKEYLLMKYFLITKTT